MKKTRKVLQILRCLVKEELINGFTIIEDDFILVYFKYINGRSLIKSIKQVSKISDKKYVKSGFMKHNKHEYIMLFTNKEGIIFGTLEDSFGGEVVLTIG